MKEGESIETFFNRVSNIVNQIRTYGDTIEDVKIVQNFLISLPPKYDHIVAAIEESKDLSTLTLNQLMGSLQAHEDRMRRHFEQLLEQALQAKLKFSYNEENENGHGRNFPQKGGTSNYHRRGRENQASPEND